MERPGPPKGTSLALVAAVIDAAAATIAKKRRMVAGLLGIGRWFDDGRCCGGLTVRWVTGRGLWTSYTGPRRPIRILVGLWFGVQERGLE